MRELPCWLLGNMFATVGYPLGWMDVSVIVSSGCPGFQWLKALNPSTRSSRPAFSMMLKRLDSDRSARISPGPRITLRDESPKSPHTGCVKVLSVEPETTSEQNHCWCDLGHLGAPGLKLALSESVLLLPLSAPTMVKGIPPWTDEMMPYFQPPITSSASFGALPRIALPVPMGRA